MNNLGLYRLIVIWSKKLGGPQNLLALAGAVGYTTGKGIEALVKKLYKVYQENETKKNLNTYTIKQSLQITNELYFELGDKFNILEVDKNSVLIEKLGDTNNPYFVDKRILTTISDFK